MERRARCPRWHEPRTRQRFATFFILLIILQNAIWLDTRLARFSYDESNEISIYLKNRMENILIIRLIYFVTGEN